MSRLLRFGLPVLAVLPLTSIGCFGDDLDGPTAPEPEPGGVSLITFTEAERQRAIAAARGQDAEVALFVYHAYRDGGGACPRRETVGETTTLTGGCATPSGDRIAGRIIATGPSASPTSVVFDGFAVNGATDLVLDGEILSIRNLDDTFVRTHALTAIRDDLGVRSDFVARCTLSDCTIDPGGAIEVLGREPVEPSRVGREISLKGKDTLRQALPSGDDCGRYGIYTAGSATTPWIEGTACLWSRGGAPTVDPSGGVRSFTYTCTDGALSARVESNLDGRVVLGFPTRFTWNGRFAPVNPNLPVYATASFDRLQADATGMLVASARILGLDCDGAADVMGWQGTVFTADGQRRDSIELFAVPPVRLDR